MATGLYLYCLREPSGTVPGTCHALSVIKSPGVNGRDGVFIRVFDGIETVVSEVNADSFREMQKKAQEDIHWIKEKALAHEAVVEEAMGENVGDMKASNGRAGQPVPPFDSVGQGCPTVLHPINQAVNLRLF